MCWSGRQDFRDSWAIERRLHEREPRIDERVSDADRQATIDQLSRHTGDGRLTLEEFEARVDETWRATTRGELAHVLRELPIERPQTRQRHSAGRVRAMAIWALILVGAVVLIGPGSLWWLAPLAFFRFGGFPTSGHDHRGREHHNRELQQGVDLTRV
jgi:hypothetical protein